MKLSTPVYILGLKRNFRGERLLNLMSTYFKEVQVFYGFDAYSSSQAKIEDFMDLNLIQFLMHREISQGEAGCAISHKMIHDDIASRQLQSALILEDDCLLTDIPMMLTIIQEFNQLVSRNPRSPIALQLGSLHFSYTKDEYEPLLKKIKFPSYGTFGYLLSQPAAVLLSEKNLKISSTADWPIWSLDFQWYKPALPLIHVQLENSTILHDRSEIYLRENKQKFLKYLKKALRYLSTIFGYRFVIARRYKIPVKLIWKWDIEFKYWRKKLEKRITSQSEEDLRYE